MTVEKIIAYFLKKYKGLQSDRFIFCDFSKLSPQQKRKGEPHFTVIRPCRNSFNSIGNGVFLVQRKEQMLTEVAFAEQLYADVLVLIVGQRDLFQRLRNTDGTQLVINVVNTVRQFENERILFFYG